MEKDRLFLVKLGGSLITDKRRPYTPRLDIIKRLAREIRDAISGDTRLIVGHGGGSFPHVSATKYETYKGFIDDESIYGMAIVHRDAVKLNSIVINEFLKVGLKVFPIHPSNISIAEDFKIKEIYVRPIQTLLKHGIIPVVHGDVGIDLNRGCCILSTEEIFNHITVKLQDEYYPFIVMCGVVDGIYTKDPLKYPDAEFIGEVSSKNINAIRNYLSTSHGIDVTGGMQHKIDILFEMARRGINSIIINGLVENNLKNVLKGKFVKGTIIRY